MAEYRAERNGNIVNIKTNKVIKYQLNKNGYCIVKFCKDNKISTKTVHRLVALAFIPNPKNKPTVNHKDGNKENNHVDNLEWATHKENIAHAFELGLRVRTKNMGRPSVAVTSLNLKGDELKDFDSISDAARYYKVSQGNITAILKRKRKQTKGISFKTTENEP